MPTAAAGGFEDPPAEVLNATDDGAALYGSYGFTIPRHPALQLRTVRTPL
ncbi:hypothetical protein ABT115_20555 [Streptomyces sp. NPDC001832]